MVFTWLHATGLLLIFQLWKGCWLYVNVPTDKVLSGQDNKWVDYRATYWSEKRTRFRLVHALSSVARLYAKQAPASDITCKWKGTVVNRNMQTSAAQSDSPVNSYASKHLYLVCLVILCSAASVPVRRLKLDAPLVEIGTLHGSLSFSQT